MRLRIRSFRRFVILALPCWLLGGPLAATLQSVAACPHHDAMPSSHGAGSHAPCWCADMSGAAVMELPTPPAATLEHAAALIAVLPDTTLGPPQSIPLPSSPSFAPTPPPPNSLS